MTVFKNISIIIPVYNAAEFITRAVKSALIFDETKEVILIEDGSKDDTLDVCRALEIKYEIVKLYCHSGNINKGISASRNLGIMKATGDYISFLDADDYYLPNRFDIERFLFSNNPNVDGVYGCLVAKFKSEDVKNKFYSQHQTSTTTFTERLPPDKLFKALLFGGFGYFSTDTITVNRKIFLKTGLFNEGLAYGEDSEMWLRIALKGNLHPGEISQPVAIRFVHEDNSTHDFESVKRYKNKMYYTLFKWALTNGISFENINNIFNAILLYTRKTGYSVNRLFWQLVVTYPSIISNLFFFKKLNLLYFKKD